VRYVGHTVGVSREVDLLSFEACLFRLMMLIRNCSAKHRLHTFMIAYKCEVRINRGHMLSECVSSYSFSF